MTVYYLYLKGTSEGCDYTLGCNELLHRLDASTAQDAYDKALELLTGDMAYFGDQVEPRTRPYDEFEVAHAMIMIAINNIPLEELRADARATYAAQCVRDKEERERADLARLQKKYGSG